MEINIHRSSKDSDIFVGDIHGEFRTILNKFKRLEITNSNIFMCGDFGVGFYKIAYYEAELKRLEDWCIEHECKIFVIRGNHDNPAFFKSPSLLPFDNIVFVGDYDVVVTRTRNVMCIGGAISIDRYNRNSFLMLGLPDHFKKEGKDDWWEDEPVTAVYVNKLVEYLKDLSINIDTVVSHTSPPEFKTDGIGKVYMDAIFDVDPELKEDLIKENEIMSNILNVVSSSCDKIEWFYGHFHTDNVGEYGNVKYKCLNINELIG